MAQVFQVCPWSRGIRPVPAKAYARADVREVIATMFELRLAIRPGSHLGRVHRNSTVVFVADQLIQHGPPGTRRAWPVLRHHPALLVFGKISNRHAALAGLLGLVAIPGNFHDRLAAENRKYSVARPAADFLVVEFSGSPGTPVDVPVTDPEIETPMNRVRILGRNPNVEYISPGDDRRILPGKEDGRSRQQHKNPGYRNVSNHVSCSFCVASDATR